MRWMLALCVVGSALVWQHVARASCETGTDSSISQYGVTITFDAPYACGRFANGDYWVAPAAPGGTVQVQSMDPAYDGTFNGWEVNPDDPVKQGFDSRVADFDAARVPALPYAAHAGQSLVKSTSSDLTNPDCRPCLQTAIVVTVLDQAPADKGVGMFRPPYFGKDKVTYNVADLHLDKRPSLATVADAPTLDTIATRFQRVQLDHKTNWTGRNMHPVDNMPDYGSDIGRDTGDGALRLLLDDVTSATQPALVAYVQYGIDLFHMSLGGVTWPANGGHSSGRRLPVTFAGVLLDHAAMKSLVHDAAIEDFGELGHIYVGALAGKALYGQDCGESMYWQNQIDDSGARDCRDPYGAIDGGKEPGDSYQFCCTSEVWKGTGLALMLLPEMRCTWNQEPFLEYVDRWVTFGAWSQPDTCAPADGDPAHLGVTFGPDGKGGCIQDTDPTCTADELAQGAKDPCIGRWPGKHGSAKDDGYYGSAFAGSMWKAYRSTVTGAPDCNGTDGGAGAAGSAGSGGMAGTGGNGGVAGTAGKDAGSGGIAGTAGVAGHASGAGGAAGAPAEASDDSGCGCRLAGSARGVGAAGWLLALAAAWCVRRRRTTGN